MRLTKETAARCEEVFQPIWTDLDLVTNTVRITPEKSSNPRTKKISNRLATTLGNLPRTSERLFDYKNMHGLRKTFEKQRRRVAHKLGNPRILRIHFHTLRHWKATMEHHKTKDTLDVLQLLGHKNIKNTLKHTQLVNFQSDEYTCRTARNLKEATKLIEAGFEYVTEVEGHKIFRERK